MQIVWDERKRQINLEKHGLDFADLNTDFFEHSLIIDGKKGRLLAIGFFEGFGILVAHVRYGQEAISVISMRRASAKERDML
jgi:uncharacterized protein